jgi:hypothetical protein
LSSDFSAPNATWGSQVGAAYAAPDFTSSFGPPNVTVHLSACRAPPAAAALKSWDRPETATSEGRKMKRPPSGDLFIEKERGRSRQAIASPSRFLALRRKAA